MQQREIKFRVWQTDAKKWAELGTLFIQDNTQALKIPGFYPGLNGRPSCQYILSQFTGLKDAEGNGIFEGDIIKDGGYHEYDIEYKDRWVIRYKADGFYGCGFTAEYPNGDEENLSQNFHKIIVIGNIFEHPELLEK